MVPFTGYRIDIQQGNAVTQEMVSKLKPGMTRAQVRFVLGTPLIVDAFRTDRWDYVYYFDQPNKPRVYRHLVVVFKGDRLERFEGDTLPALDYTTGTVSDDKTPSAGEDKPATAAAGGAAAGENTNANTKATEQNAPPKEAQSETNEKNPTAQAPEKEDRGYSKPIMDSLGF